MIRELGEVVQVDGRFVTISTQLKSGCGGCQHQNHCGAGLLSKALPRRRGDFVIETDQQLALGQQVELQLPEQALTRFSLLMYLVPLLALIAGAGLGTYLAPSNELVSIALGAFGLAFSFVILRRLLRHRDVKVQSLLQILPVKTA